MGNIPQLSGDRMFYEKLNDLRKRHGDIVFITLGSLKILVVYGHELVKEVLGPRDEEFKYRPQWLIEIQKLGLFNGKFIFFILHALPVRLKEHLALQIFCYPCSR